MCTVLRHYRPKCGTVLQHYRPQCGTVLRHYRPQNISLVSHHGRLVNNDMVTRRKMMTIPRRKVGKGSGKSDEAE